MTPNSGDYPHSGLLSTGFKHTFLSIKQLTPDSFCHAPNVEFQEKYRAYTQIKNENTDLESEKDKINLKYKELFFSSFRYSSEDINQLRLLTEKIEKNNIFLNVQKKEIDDLFLDFRLIKTIEYLKECKNLYHRCIVEPIEQDSIFCLNLDSNILTLIFFIEKNFDSLISYETGIQLSSAAGKAFFDLPYCHFGLLDKNLSKPSMLGNFIQKTGVYLGFNQDYFSKTLQKVTDEFFVNSKELNATISILFKEIKKNSKKINIHPASSQEQKSIAFNYIINNTDVKIATLEKIETHTSSVVDLNQAIEFVYSVLNFIKDKELHNIIANMDAMKEIKAILDLKELMFNGVPELKPTVIKKITEGLVNLEKYSALLCQQEKEGFQSVINKAFHMLDALNKKIPLPRFETKNRFLNLDKMVEKIEPTLTDPQKNKALYIKTMMLVMASVFEIMENSFLEHGAIYQKNELDELSEINIHYFHQLSHEEQNLQECEEILTKCYQIIYKLANVQLKDKDKDNVISLKLKVFLQYVVYEINKTVYVEAALKSVQRKNNSLVIPAHNTILIMGISGLIKLLRKTNLFHTLIVSDSCAKNKKSPNLLTLTPNNETKHIADIETKLYLYSSGGGGHKRMALK